MNFNPHYELEGQHAFLGASKYHWIYYDDKKLITSYEKSMAVKKGTELHDIACSLIRNRIKLPANSKTLNSYVNDAIGYRMTPEQVLYFSPNCFGTADAISFKKNTLRIHDLKTGSTPAHIEQLYVYTALFCLEYAISPCDISIELRIYQSDKKLIDKPDPDDILHIMDKMKTFDRIIEEMKMED